MWTDGLDDATTVGITTAVETTVSIITDGITVIGVTTVSVIVVDLMPTISISA
jgi:hypothetical protein